MAFPALLRLVLLFDVNEDGPTDTPQWPLLKTMLPQDLGSMSVLDLGCGDGWFCRWAAGEGAAQVLGMDASNNMLDRARRLSAMADERILFKQADLETVSLQQNAYDLVFSGLALHYVVNLGALLRQVHRSLRPGGSFVFSVEHPIFTAPVSPHFEPAKSSLHGCFWPLSNYFTEGGRTVTWLGSGVKKQHHTLSGYIKAVLSAGFTVEAVDEWGATDDESRKHPDWPNQGVIPRFLLVSAKK